MASKKTSMASDNESNISGLIRCNDQKITELYMSAVGKMELINQDLLQVEHNLKRIADQAGPLESTLYDLMRTLPIPEFQRNMETE